MLVTLGGIAGHGRYSLAGKPFDNTVFLVPEAWLEQSADDTDAHVPGAVSHHRINRPVVRRTVRQLRCADHQSPAMAHSPVQVAQDLPVLYAKRGDWPEEPYLIDWLGSRSDGPRAIDMPPGCASGEFA